MNKISNKYELMAFATFVSVLNLAIIDLSVNDKTYEYSDDDLDLLAGMYKCGMTPKEAAETFFASKERIITPRQLNYKVAGICVKQLNENGSDLLFVVGKHPVLGINDLLTAPGCGPDKLLEALDHIAKMLQKMQESIKKKKDQ